MASGDGNGDAGDRDAGDRDAGDRDADELDGGESTDVDAYRTGDGDSDAPAADEQYCSSCGSIIKKEAEICPECGVRQKPAGEDYEKDRVTAGVLAILLGWAGVHRFYLGDTGLGLLYLCFFWTMIPGIVGLVEGILYLTKTDEEFQARYVD